MNAIEHILLEKPVTWMQRQIEQVSAFLWHYYVAMFLFMAILSMATVRIHASVEREGESIRSSKAPVVQSIIQLNEVTSKVTNRR